jgi:CheY-like chemotaxis protein
VELTERAAERLRLRVLIIDDEPEIAEVAAEFLERAGMDVILAPNGQTALDLILGDPAGVDVVLSDLAMPTLGGEAVRDELTRRQLPLARHFVFMCGDYRDADRLRATGAVVIEKPFEDARQLAKIVMQAATRH